MRDATISVCLPGLKAIGVEGAGKGLGGWGVRGEGVLRENGSKGSGLGGRKLIPFEMYKYSLQFLIFVKCKLFFSLVKFATYKKSFTVSP